jgi:hypothetical protein
MRVHDLTNYVWPLIIGWEWEQSTNMYNGLQCLTSTIHTI